MTRATAVRRGLAALAVATATALGACGEEEAAGGGGDSEYPTKPITFITHSEPGSGGDLFARPFTDLLSDELGVDVRVENRPGGITASAMAALDQAQPDGYTLMVLNDSYITTPLATPDAGYDARKDLKVICRVIVESTVIAVAADSPYDSFDALMSDLDSKTQKWGVQGFTTGDGVLVRRLIDEYDKKIEPVPYDDGAGVASALMAGDIVATVAGLNEVDQLVKSGDLRVLATSNSERLTGDYADIPTLTESGIDIQFDRHRGLAGPPGTPDHVVRAISEATQAVLEKPEYREQISAELSVPAFQDSATYEKSWLALDAFYRPVLTKSQ